MKQIFTTNRIMKLAIFAASLTMSQFGNAQTTTTIAGNGTGTHAGDGSAATGASLQSPAYVKTDAMGNIYVADKLNNRVRKISATGVITTIAGTGGTVFSGDGGAATAATLWQPMGVAVDGSGNVYISDATHYRIRKINTAGIISTIAGTGTTGFGTDGVAATATNIGAPAGICFDAAGNLVFAERSYNRVRKIDMTTGIISTIAGTGSSSFGGDGAAATAAFLNQPYDVNYDTAGNLYIADYNNNRIRKVNAAGIISTYAGDGTTTFSGDGGAATAASLYKPSGVWADSAGNVFIADTWHNKVRKVGATGTISSVAGTGAAGYGGDGGTGAVAVFNYPSSITMDNSGNLYLTDDNNHRVRKIARDVITITGATNICVSGSTTLSASVPMGAWTSGSATVATVGLMTGVVTGVSAGTAVITYQTSLSSATRIITVNPAVPAITGTTSVCAGATTTLSNTTTGGSWSSSTTGTATVDGSGVVTGVTAGTTTISYTAGGCSATAAVTVNALPAAITGSTSVCIGNTTLMSNTTAGGTWSSSTTGTATIDASGLVAGISAGSATITYTLASGCYTTANVNVISCPTNIDMIADGDKTITIFPNPSNGEFEVVLPAIAAPTEITISDISGKIIESTAYAGKDNIRYSLKVNAGCYVIKVTAGNKTYRKVLIITGQ